LDVVVVAPIQARTPAEPITREQVNEQAARMKRAAVRRQQEAADRERARQRAVAASSSNSSAGSSGSAGSNRRGRSREVSNRGGARSSGASSSSGVGTSSSSSGNHGASSSGEGNSCSSSSHGMSSSGEGNSRSSSPSRSGNLEASSGGVGNSRSSSHSSSSNHGASSSGVGNSRGSSHNSSSSSRGTSSSGAGNSRNSCSLESGSGEGNSRTTSRAVTSAEEREAATQLSREVADGNMQAGENAISARDLMDDDGPGNALEAFKALHHPERKAAEKLLISNGLRDAEKRKMRQYGHLINESVGFMAVPFSAFGSTVPRVAKLLKGMAKRQKQDKVWDIGEDKKFKPDGNVPPVLIYANLSLLFDRFHAKIIPWGPKSQNFVELVQY